MSEKFNLPSDFGDEARRFRELLEKGSNRTITGFRSFTSSTSGTLYQTNNGEEGMFSALGQALSDYLIDKEYVDSSIAGLQAHVNNVVDAHDINILQGQVDAHVDNVVDAHDINIHYETQATLNTMAHVKTGVISITLDSESWVGSEAPYIQTVTATGVSAGEVATVDLDFSGVATYEDQVEIFEAWGDVHRVVASGDDEITVYMNEEPEVNIPITIKVVI